MEQFTEKLPIMAYIGPKKNATQEDFYTFKECGFDIALQNFDTLKELQDYCSKASKADIQVIGQYPAMHNTGLEEAATKLKSQKGFWQYFLQDEPSSSQLISLEKELESIKAIDDTHGFYSNLYSYYNKDVLKLTETNTYDEYLKNAEKLNTTQISFDFYPVRKNKIRDTWYSNLEKIRQMSLRTGKPFWGFILSCPHGNYYQPTDESVRLQAYMNLAYGAKGIEYFTYWTPDDYADYHFYNAPIEKDGTKTITYDIVKNMNNELNALGSLFVGSDIVNIQHTSRNIFLKHKAKENITNVYKLTVTGKNGVCISEFRNGECNYCIIVNKDIEKGVILKLDALDCVHYINKELKEFTHKEKYYIKPGDCIIFKLN